MAKDYSYQLRNEQGYFMHDVSSTVQIHVDNIINYKGKKLAVIEKDGHALIVKPLGAEITVK